MKTYTNVYRTKGKVLRGGEEGGWAFTEREGDQYTVHRFDTEAEAEATRGKLAVESKVKLTAPQQRLLDTIDNKGIVPVRGSKLAVARALEDKGLVKVSINGQAWVGRWWYEARRA